MRLSLLTFACSPHLFANAFHLYGSGGSWSDVQPEACIKALTAEIHCNKYVAYYRYGWFPVLEDDDGNEITHDMCTKTCSRSLKTFNTAVHQECDLEDLIAPGYNIWRSWNLTCDTDAETGRYCTGPHDIVPTKDLCRPCHIRHVFNLDLDLPSSRSTGFGPKEQRYFKDLRARIYMECPKEALAETFAPISQEGASNTTESAQETSTMSDTGSTTATTAATRSTVTVTSSPSAASTSTERNMARKGYMFSYWALVLMFF
ncbi:hypothetical protein FPHYL_14153 [Fusarium phyllophilum]|uniref:Uncharacterized protein n=1 Tax=Fusarium phyllophilum TaxID=47803 RepID=A0A8H5I4I0_9HYPO|nr:hypothetical protein FPHYL_14153 [Fusarium phyllophilum]